MTWSIETLAFLLYKLLTLTSDVGCNFESALQFVIPVIITYKYILLLLLLTLKNDIHHSTWLRLS